MLEIKTIEEFNSGLFIFSASWCGPCKLLTAFLQENEQRLNEIGLELYKIDMDSDVGEELFSQLSIRSVPTLVYKSGENTQILSKPYDESLFETLDIVHNG